MERFAITWNGEAAPPSGLPQHVESDNWMVAVGMVVEELKRFDYDIGTVACEHRPDGFIEVSDPMTGASILFEQLPDEDTSDEDTEVDPGRLAQATAAAAAGRAASDMMDVEDEETVKMDETEELADGSRATFDEESGTVELTLAEAPDPLTTPVFEADTPNVLEQVRSQAATRLQGLSWPQQLASAALDLLLQHVPAESASVLVLEADKGMLRFVATRGPRAGKLDGMAIPNGAGIAGMAMRLQTAVLVREVKEDPNHYEAVDAHTGYQTSSLLAVPLLTETGSVGVLELLNPFGATSFAPWHQQAAIAVTEAMVAAAANRQQ